MQVNKTLCVFTPTYNRAYTLPRLYKSLKAQVNKDFVWLVVDDGSTDDTESLMIRYRKEDMLSIFYIKVCNGGKQRAHNRAVELCNSELFLCVDSDDYLAPDAVEELLKTWDIAKKNTNVAGVVFLKGFSMDVPLGTAMPSGVETLKLKELYSKYHFRGDTGLMYRTKVLKKHPFYIAPGEKFIGENYIYDQIDQEYDLKVLNKILYIAEYLPDGYSKNIRQITKENPIGYLTLKRQAIKYEKSFFKKFKETILYLVGCRLAKKKRAIITAPSRFLAVVAYFPSRLVYLLFFR